MIITIIIHDIASIAITRTSSMAALNSLQRSCENDRIPCDVCRLETSVTDEHDNAEVVQHPRQGADMEHHAVQFNQPFTNQQGNPPIKQFIKQFSKACISCPVCRLETSVTRERDNAQVVQQLRQGAEVRLQAMEAAVASSLQQQQQLYSSIHHMTSQFMQQKSTDLAALQARLAGILAQ